MLHGQKLILTARLLHLQAVAQREIVVSACLIVWYGLHTARLPVHFCISLRLRLLLPSRLLELSQG